MDADSYLICSSDIIFAFSQQGGDMQNVDDNACQDRWLLY